MFSGREVEKREQSSGGEERVEEKGVIVAVEHFNSLFYKLGYYSEKIKRDYTVIITIFL